MRVTVLTLLLTVATASAVTAGQAGVGTKLSGVWTIDKTQGTAAGKPVFDLVLTVKRRHAPRHAAGGRSPQLHP